MTRKDELIPIIDKLRNDIGFYSNLLKKASYLTVEEPEIDKLIDLLNDLKIYKSEYREIIEKIV